MKKKKNTTNASRWYLMLEYVFFQNKQTKALRRKYHGDALVIYLKMMLCSLRSECILRFERYEDSFAEEVASEIDEDDIDLVESVIDFLKTHDLMIEKEKDVFYLPQASEMARWETRWAEQKRNQRAAKDGDADNVHDDADNVGVLISTDISTDTYRDTDIAISTAISVSEQEQKQKQTDSDSVSEGAPSAAAADRRAVAPVGYSVEDLTKLASDKKIKVTPEEIGLFHKETDRGTTLWNKPITDITRAFRGWVKSRRDNGIEYVEQIDSNDNVVDPDEPDKPDYSFSDDEIKAAKKYWDDRVQKLIRTGYFTSEDGRTDYHVRKKYPENYETLKEEYGEVALLEVQEYASRDAIRQAEADYYAEVWDCFIGSKWSPDPGFPDKMVKILDRNLSWL